MSQDAPEILDVRPSVDPYTIIVLIRTGPADYLNLYTRQVGGEWSCCDMADDVEGVIQLTDDETPQWGIYEPVEYMATTIRAGTRSESDVFGWNSQLLMDAWIGASDE